MQGYLRMARKHVHLVHVPSNSGPAHGASAGASATLRLSSCRYPRCRVASDVAGGSVRCIQLKGRLSVLVGNGREPTWDLALVAEFHFPRVASCPPGSWFSAAEFSGLDIRMIFPAQKVKFSEPRLFPT
jgi:hypothetical protein